MEKTVSIREVDNALTGLVIDSPETVGVILKMVKHVKHTVQLVGFFILKMMCKIQCYIFFLYR